MRWLLLFATAIHLLCGCGTHQNDGRNTNGVLRLATTTSTRDSGLLDVLLPEFEREQNVRVDVVAVGTGKALKLGEAGDVDAVIVHAREAEDTFVAGEHAVRREDVMYNTFEILGPPEDPAELSGMSPALALRTIAAAKQRFVSRGDDSGTHQREMKLWQGEGGRPRWEEYVESGQGMGATLIMADQMNAYVLADRGTYLRFKSKISLVPLVSASDELKNPYGVLVVNPAKHPAIRAKLADALVDFLISPATQRRIRAFTLDGEPLFYPMHAAGHN